MSKFILETLDVIAPVFRHVEKQPPLIFIGRGIGRESQILEG
jgi:hypothetical protein